MLTLSEDNEDEQSMHLKYVNADGNDDLTSHHSFEGEDEPHRSPELFTEDSGMIN